jgi:hypothetical protein
MSIIKKHKIKEQNWRKIKLKQTKKNNLTVTSSSLNLVNVIING